MQKRIVYMILSVIFVLPLVFFSFGASAETAIFPIPGIPNDQKYGQNVIWDNFFCTSMMDVSSGLISSITEQDYNTFPHRPPHITRYTCYPDFSDPDYTVLTFSMDFVSEDGANKIFDLSKDGYAQVLFDTAIEGYSDRNSNKPIKPASVTVSLYGNYTGKGEASDYDTPDHELEYILLRGWPCAVYSTTHKPTVEFQNCTPLSYGTTITYQSMKSTTIKKIRFEIAFYGEISICNFYLGDINVRKYNPDGSSKDGKAPDGTSPPPLDPNQQGSSDMEGAIQDSTNSINNNIDNQINGVNNKIDGLNGKLNDVNGNINGLNNRLDDLKNDDMGYSGTDNPEMDEGLNSGDSLLDTMNNVLNHFDKDMDSAFTSLYDRLYQVKTMVNTFWDAIPIYVTGTVTAVVVFLVIRKVVGR